LGVSFDDAVAILNLRQREDTLLKRHMIVVRDRYNGDFVMPLPNVEGEPEIDPPVPALIADAIDSTAMRAASTRPQIFVPALNPASQQSMKRAERRRKAYYAQWHRSRLPLKLRRATRHLVGYGTNCMGVIPCFDPKGRVDHDYAKIEVRDPLTAYPDESSAEEVRLPTNIGFIYPRSVAWIVQNYPEARDFIFRSNRYRGQGDNDEMWDFFEWVDDEKVYLGLMGPRMTQTHSDTIWGGSRAPMLLREYPNRAGMVPYVCPGRVTLDRIAGQVTKMVGIVDMYAKLMALEAVAAEKAVFADKYILARQSEDIVMVSGNDWKDGRSGEINLVQGAQQVGQLVDPMNPSTFTVADRMERAVRHSSGTPGVFGGELTGAIRSGQTVNQIGAYAIDPRVQEVQEILEYQLTCVNEAVHEVTKAYWPNRTVVAFSGWATDRGHVEYTPAKDFEDPSNVVSYGLTGADVSQLSVALGQAMQMKLIDRRTAQRKHPLVDNPDDAEKAIIEEALTDAALASFLARAQAGTLAEIDLLNVLKHFRQNGGDFIQATISAQEDAQERQAARAAEPGPGMAVAPETMPGLSPPGSAGVESMSPSGGGMDAGGMAQLLEALQGQGSVGAPNLAGVL
jgi:hypothetical protein